MTLSDTHQTLRPHLSYFSLCCLVVVYRWVLFYPLCLTSLGISHNSSTIMAALLSLISFSLFLSAFVSSWIHPLYIFDAPCPPVVGCVNEIMMMCKRYVLDLGLARGYHETMKTFQLCLCLELINKDLLSGFHTLNSGSAADAEDAAASHQCFLLSQSSGSKSTRAVLRRKKCLGLGSEDF